MAAKSALITGITGQDGTYLAELLLGKGYRVHGLSRTAAPGDASLVPVHAAAARAGGDFRLHACDMVRSEDVHRLVGEIGPDEIYNLAAQSHVKHSFDSPESTVDVNGLGVVRLLEAIRSHRLATRFFQAASAELFGNPAESPQTEETAFRPRSPYAVAKLYAYWMVRNYRESYGMHASNGILFNHESPRRGVEFVTRKITATLARIRAGSGETLRLGHLDVRRDWGYARDYVDAMWRMLQQPEADDYVVATGESHTVREFVERSAAVAGLDLAWEGAGSDEVGRDRKTGNVIVAIDPRFYRIPESAVPRGDAGKARKRLGWVPEVTFDGLVELMAKADMALADRAGPVRG